MRPPEPTWSIPLSFAVGLVLTVYPLPEVLAHWRPDWLNLLLIFWIFNHPGRTGVWTAFMVGVVADLVLGDTLGVYALSFSVVAYLTRSFIRKARVSSLIATSLLVGGLLAVALALRFVAYSLVGQAQNDWQYWLPAVTSALAWPFVVMSMQRWRRNL